MDSRPLVAVALVGGDARLDLQVDQPDRLSLDARLGEGLLERPREGLGVGRLG
jgi:hypothetical protein